ncbi:DUF4268 domain-containing protein [Gimesia sp.]|uniref:DUF4268 domain-containing protein n=1 Tax=Gimesia sp. TaxID=2024833 RepID=UPI000C399785|nr:DUF4268 domain-containing protein [Gimesia sp.]MAX40114.1 hypothetical protein [Gimesia sp.]HAH49107.1 hypothetical protein [Planctomycetaceae bacterium]HBL44604.1 hypothetical protein [Planctomycetaceae bacterium]|tara:strand:- start:619 stop:1770 length:1152 start_codon:yes stop_codon:yes gene_type:complete
MYKIDKATNRIIEVDSPKFSELGFTERHHLQEWLAHTPAALGEELLIIQKEFDGFDDTKERLDLLALDKDGNLVIIENKLDDSGRDVVWQALKYASYCSTFTKEQIIKSYQEFLNKSGRSDEDAASNVIEFLEFSDLEEVVLNSTNTQRLMFVAANFRKEVTSTALWLLGNGISLQCIKVTPYRHETDLYLNVEQIIPTPEAEELMISINAKAKEEKETVGKQHSRYRVRLQYWEQAVIAFHKSDCHLFENISPSKDQWISAGSGVSGCTFTLIFGKSESRVEVIMGRSDLKENKLIFDALASQKVILEEKFGHPLIWYRNDDKKVSRIQYPLDIDGYDKENWPTLIDWMVKHMTRLEKTFKQPLLEAAEQMKKTLQEPVNTV